MLLIPIFYHKNNVSLFICCEFVAHRLYIYLLWLIINILMFCKINKIKAGEFYVVRFTDCLVNDQATDIIGLFKSENKDIFLNIYTEQNDLHIESLSGINTHKLDKGCLIFNIEKMKDTLYQ